MEVAVVVIVALILMVGLAVAVIAVVGHNQQRALARDNQLIPGRPTRAPKAWAVAHDPEARLHRRLRDAMTALHAANSVETGSPGLPRPGLGKTAIDLAGTPVSVPP